MTLFLSLLATAPIVALVVLFVLALCAAASRRVPGPTFMADSAAITLEAQASDTFEVSTEKRTIRGLAVPYGEVASSNGRKFQFSKGSLTWADVKRVKMLVGHDRAQAVGVATALDDREDGLHATFSIARGALGDSILSLAEDGVMDGLSIGLGAAGKFAIKDGVYHAQPGGVPLSEISITSAPSFDNARLVGAFSGDNPEQAAEAAAAFSTDMRKAIVQGFGDAFSLINPQAEGRERMSAAEGLEVTEPSPYRFDGIKASACFMDDMRSAQQGDGEARQRLEAFGDEFATFAVTTANVGSLNVTKNRPDLYVPNLTFPRPLWDAVSTGSVEDKTPFTVPKFASAAGLVGMHTEGVEPTPGSFAATVQTITPTPMSGKIQINREVLDQGGSPQADQIIWGEMLNAYYEAIEARIASRLQATTTAELNLGSVTDAALVGALTNYFTGLQFVRGGNRFSRFVADGLLFPALVGAKDSAGRNLLPVLNPHNAQGSTDAAFSAVQFGYQPITAAWALANLTSASGGQRSFSFVPSSVWCWASTPKKFTFEYQVMSVDMAIWGYEADAILRDSDVKPIDYAVAD